MRRRPFSEMQRAHFKVQRCKHCGAGIYLVKTGKETHKWVTDPHKPHSWKCTIVDAHAPLHARFPVRSHMPGESA